VMFTLLILLILNAWIHFSIMYSYGIVALQCFEMRVPFTCQHSIQFKLNFQQHLSENLQPAWIRSIKIVWCQVRLVMGY
jgi:uncharacterized membrane protein YagU involved in acid resistance